MVDNTIKVYEQHRLTFILTPQKTIIKTGIQAFYLEPVSHYYRRRITLIRKLIMLGEIQDLDELASFCKHGKIEWVNMNRNSVDLLVVKEQNKTMNTASNSLNSTMDALSSGGASFIEVKL